MKNATQTDGSQFTKHSYTHIVRLVLGLYTQKSYSPLISPNGSITLLCGKRTPFCANRHSTVGHSLVNRQLLQPAFSSMFPILFDSHGQKQQVVPRMFAQLSAICGGFTEGHWGVLSIW